MGILAYRQPGDLAPTPAVRTAQVRRGAIGRVIRIPGVTSALSSKVIVAPQMRGHRGNGQDASLALLEIAPAGTRVRKGEIVARFDPLYMRNRLIDSDALVAQGESRLRTLRALLDVKRMRYEQMILRARGDRDKAALDLEKIAVFSEIQAERYRLLHQEAAARHQELLKEAVFVDLSELASIRRSEIGVELSRMNREREQANLEKMTVTAPVDGMVLLQSVTRGTTTRQIEQGDIIGSGQPYLKIMDSNSMVIDAALNQVDIQSVHKGQTALIRFDAYPELLLAARVETVGALTTSSRWRGKYVRAVPVRLKLEQQDTRIMPEMTVSADVNVESEVDATIVPRECVFGGSSRQYALVKAGEDWERRDLETGAADNIHVSIRSGLSPGETVAAEPPQ
ncbi:MAG TPA: HlyD family efflux transporter periplasmic adaptor subunit [Bryobacteraceae bacterium]|nr:HlyD family efflux transporter periplasmic adaptor subunit [Bryobacteraceae bacterium]